MVSTWRYRRSVASGMTFIRNLAASQGMDPWILQHKLHNANGSGYGNGCCIFTKCS